MPSFTRCMLLFAGLGLAVHAGAQALPAATGPGNYLAVGGGISLFQADYGKRDIAGAVFFADVHPNWRWGVEGEARYLRLNADEDVNETNYLIGPRYVFRPYGFRRTGLRPYVKFLVGTGKITFPFKYEEGRFFTYAPGGGVELPLGSTISLRLVDFEYQVWPDFVTYGQLRPYGVSTGISIRFNAADRAPHGLKH
jgi:hypothetical protein